MTRPEDELGGYNRWLGLEVLEATGDRVVAACDVRPDHLQPYGIVHGGVHSSLVETVASVAAAHWLGERGKVVGVSNHTDFLRAVRDGRLTATGTPIHRGRLQQLWVVEIRDGGDRLVARGQVRLQNIGADHLTR
ncbi:MAG: PaaI family thioesterase [Gaiellaceae bacterium]